MRKDISGKQTIRKPDVISAALFIVRIVISNR